MSRRYIEDSAILETTVGVPAGVLRFTDWLTLGQGDSGALCRQFSGTPAAVTIWLEAWGSHRRQRCACVLVDGVAAFEEAFFASPLVPASGHCHQARRARDEAGARSLARLIHEGAGFEVADVV